MSSRTAAPSARAMWRVDQRVVRRRVAAHQLHRRPVLLPVVGGQVEPRQVRERVRQLGMMARARRGCSASPPAFPVPRLPEWLSSARYSPGGEAERRRRATVRTPNSTKWLPLPLVPSCDQALSFRPAVTRATRSSPRPSPRAGAGRGTSAPMPKRVSPSSAADQLLLPGRQGGDRAGRAPSSSSGRRCRRRPRRGSTALSVASTPPIGRP